MSIAYQLYLMPTINPIIIPLKQVHPSAQPTPSLQPTTLPSPPCITPPPNENFFWKKTNSAFSKFKPRKDKTNKNQLQILEDLQNEVVEIRKKVNLAIRDRCRTFLKQQFQDSMETECPYGYYDPNSAPLCQSTPRDPQKQGSNENYTHFTSSRHQQQKYQPLRTTQTSSNYKAQNKSSVKKEDRMSIQSLQVPDLQDDDPFIIVRKDSQTKFNKQYKTKFIKKQDKPELVTPTKPFQVEKESKMKVGNSKIVQKVVVNGQEMIKSVSSMCFSPPIKVLPYKRKEDKAKEPTSNPVIQISEQNEVIQIQSSQNDSRPKGSQIEIQ